MLSAVQREIRRHEPIICILECLRIAERYRKRKLAPIRLGINCRSGREFAAPLLNVFVVRFGPRKDSAKSGTEPASGILAPPQPFIVHLLFVLFRLYFLNVSIKKLRKCRSLRIRARVKRRVAVVYAQKEENDLLIRSNATRTRPVVFEVVP